MGFDFLIWEMFVIQQIFVLIGAITVYRALKAYFRRKR